MSRSATLLATAVAVGAGLVAVHVGQAQASTNGIRGVNWADQRDNFVNGVLYVSGLSASDTYSSAATVADRVVGQLYSLTGANTVRMPINEPTVANYWDTYTGAIDTALTKGNVIFAYWAYTGGKPQDTNAFYQMWDKVVAKYGGNARAYFEVINEPSGYSTTDLTAMYNTWLGRYSAVPRGNVILDGAGLATNVGAVGSDSRLNGTLIAVHDYSFFVNPPYTTESAWANHLAGLVGSYASRTVATEWGGPMSPGSKNGVYYNTIDYSVSGGNYFDAYVRGISSELRALGMGSVYWPGLRDGDWYSMTTRTGSGANIQLSVPNQSGLARLQYAWGAGSPSPSLSPSRSTAPSPSPSRSTGPSTSPGTTGACHVAYTVNQWTGGFTANLAINNTGTSTINGWTLTFAFPGDQAVTSAWNATVTQSGTAVTASNASYNGTIAPGGNATFGFQGTWSANDSSPTAFRVNGTACT